MRIAETPPDRFPATSDDAVESDAFDIVVYDFSPPAEAGEEWIDRILAPHRQGKPAVIIEGGLSSNGETPDWSEFCGAKVTPKPADSPARAPVISITRAHHPITHPLGDWVSPQDSPVLVESLFENTTLLATIDDKPACWTHLYGNQEARVFAIALGESEASIGHPSFLDLLTRGFLWAASRNITPSTRSAPSLPDPVTKLRPGNNLIISNFQAAFSSSREPELACDGDPGTAWKAGPDDLISWWQVTLNKTIHPRVIVIHRDKPHSQPWLIESSLDGNSWGPLIRLENSISPVTLHEVDAALSRIRITNSRTGTLESLFELAAYESMEQVPSHLAKLAHRPPPSLPSERKEPSVAEPTVPPAEYRLEAITRLIERIENAGNGTDRRQWIIALARLYRTPGGETWQSSGPIADFLENSLSRKNLDRRLILSMMIRESIDVRDLPRILKMTDGDSRLKFHRVRLMEHFGVPADRLDFLTRVMKDSNEALDFRLRAATLLAGSAVRSAPRDALEWYGSLSDEDLLNLEAPKKVLHSAIISSPTWEVQLEWILSTARSAEAEAHRILAWEVVTRLLADPDSRPASIGRIRSFMEDLITEESETGKTSLPLFVANTTPSQLEQPTVRRWLDRITSELPGTDLANLVTDTIRDIRSARLVGELSSSALEALLSETGPGDIEKGKILFNRACHHCHDRKGPPLEEAGPSILDSVLHPDKAISREKHTWTYQLIDGSEFTGFGAQEEATWHEVIDSAGNAVFLDKAQIRKRIRREGSTMPRDIVQAMTVGELADLMAYLEFVSRSRE